MKNFKTLWKEKANNKAITAADVFQYGILKAMTAKNPDKESVATGIIQAAFTAISNQVKLANGQRPHQAISLAWAYSHIDKYIRGFDADDLRSTLETEEEEMTFNRLADYVCKNVSEADKRHYIYFVVRQDIEPVYQMVQGMHVALGLGHTLATVPNWRLHRHTVGLDVKELYFSVVGVPNQEELIGAANYIQSVGYDVVEFREPDLNNEITAIASFPVQGNKRRFMKRYKSLKFPVPSLSDLISFIERFNVKRNDRNINNC